MSGPPPTEHLILVDARNRAIGRADKRTAHEAGLRHRAFSIFLVDAAGQLLLQRRHLAKYHSGGLWSNSCCGHPRPGERTGAAAERRLGEELGATTPLAFGFLARYRAAFANGLIENEVVYVYFGLVPDRIAPNPAEVSAVVFRDLEWLRTDARIHPDQYSVWLKYYLTEHGEAIHAGVNGVLARAAAARGRRAPRKARRVAVG